MNSSESLPLSLRETLSEETNRVLHEPQVVSALIYRLADVAHQVLEKRPEYNIENLNDLDVKHLF